MFLASSESVHHDHQSHKKRTMFTEEQKATLETFFLTQPYPDRNTRKEIADQLGVKDKSVDYWFGHRRAKKAKLDKSLGYGNASIAASGSSSSSSSSASSASPSSLGSFVDNGKYSSVTGTAAAAATAASAPQSAGEFDVSSSALRRSYISHRHPTIRRSTNAPPRKYQQNAVKSSLSDKMTLPALDVVATESVKVPLDTRRFSTGVSLLDANPSLLSHSKRSFADLSSSSTDVTLENFYTHSNSPFMWEDDTAGLDSPLQSDSDTSVDSMDYGRTLSCPSSPLSASSSSPPVSGDFYSTPLSTHRHGAIFSFPSLDFD